MKTLIIDVNQQQTVKVKKEIKLPFFAKTTNEVLKDYVCINEEGKCVKISLYEGMEEIKNERWPEHQLANELTEITEKEFMIAFNEVYQTILNRIIKAPEQLP